MNRFEKHGEKRKYYPRQLLTLSLRCSGHNHKILYRNRGAVVLLSHRYDDPKKLALAKQLGRELPLCFQILEALKEHQGHPRRLPGTPALQKKLWQIRFNTRGYYQWRVSSYEPYVPPPVEVRKPTLEESRGY